VPSTAGARTPRGVGVGIVQAHAQVRGEPIITRSAKTGRLSLTVSVVLWGRGQTRLGELMPQLE
jgi:hypothetical protein